MTIGHDEGNPETDLASAPSFSHEPLPRKPRAVSLRVKVTLVMMLVMMVSLGLSTAIEYFHYRDRSLSTMSMMASQTGQVIENALLRDMLLSDFGRIQSTFDSIAEDKRIRTLYLLDTTGRVVFAPELNGVGQTLDNRDVSCQPCHHLPPSERPSGVVVTNADGVTVFRSMHPIENRPQCMGCHGADQRLIGLLLTDLSVQPVQAALAADLRDNLIWWIGTTLVVVVLVNFATNQMVLNRLHNMAQALSGFGGESTLPHLSERPNDEIGRLSKAFNAMVERVGQRESENRALWRSVKDRMQERERLLRSLITAQEEERRRVARELHDELGQDLSGTAIRIENARRAIARDPQAAFDLLEQAQSTIAEATDRMYDMILGLRPSVLDDLGLAAALRTQCQRTLEPAGIAFELETLGLSDRLPPEIETVLFRISQEALTNVLRHAKAGNVRLRLSRNENTVEAEIQDDGIGFDPSDFAAFGDEHGLGLLGMRERVEQFGGTIEIQSRPGAGSRIRVILAMSSDVDV